jgi:hypothetical protein
MSHFEITLLVLTVIALLWTKALDVLSTWRFVGLHGESNPIARWLFEKTGLAGGMAIVCALYILILGFQIAAVVWINDSLTTYGTVALGAFTAYIQYDVARFNRSRRHSMFTGFFLQIFRRFENPRIHACRPDSQRPAFDKQQFPYS